MSSPNFKRNIWILSLAFSGIAATCALGQTANCTGCTYITGLPNNSLTAQEQADGYQLLWDGKDYAGWLINSSTTGAAPTSATNWTIVTDTGYENGARTQSANVDSNMLEVLASGASLFTQDTTFLNFDWKAEWKASVGTETNSGLLFRYQNSLNTNNDYSATEYQLDNAEWTSEWETTTETAGDDYDMLPMLPSRVNPNLSPSWVRPEGQWNQSRIIAYGARVCFYGNSLRLVNYQMLSAAWNTAYNASKYKGLGTYNTVHAGSLYLQDHGQPYVKLRDVRVKRLTQNPWAAGSPYLNADSAAKGDSTLIDTLSFAQDLFPYNGGDAISPYTIVPKYATKIVANGDGLSILFSQQGDYTLTLEDVSGARFSTHAVHNASLFFLPGQFSHSPRILTIWKGDQKIQQTMIGN